MTGLNFQVPSWLVTVAALLAVAAVITLALYFWRRFEASRTPWQQLVVVGVQNVYWYGHPDVNIRLLAVAIHEAAAALAHRSVWADRVYAALDGVHVRIVSTDTWGDNWGRKVAGLDPPGAEVLVGRNLAALCHELAHQCEFVLNRVIDDAHAGWEAKGVFAAIDEYAAVLNALTMPLSVPLSTQNRTHA